MPTKTRNELKVFFKKNAIPTESNFADLIESQLNINDDGISKVANGPLCLSGGPIDQNKENPIIKIDTKTYTINGKKTTPITAGKIELLSDRNPIILSSFWYQEGAGIDSARNAVLCNNTEDDYKMFMIVGNSSDGSGTRRVGVWDQLNVYGNLNVNKDIKGEPGNVTISGTLTVNGKYPLLTTDQGRSIELGKGWPGAVTPFVDFHFHDQKLGTDQDYNVRVINGSDKTLTIAGHSENSNPLKLEVRGEGRFHLLRVGTDGGSLVLGTGATASACDPYIDFNYHGNADRRNYNVKIKNSSDKKLEIIGPVVPTPLPPSPSTEPIELLVDGKITVTNPGSKLSQYGFVKIQYTGSNKDSPVEYFKDSLGIVHLRGVLSPNDSGEIKLPSESWPENSQWFPVSDAGIASETHGTQQIDVMVFLFGRLSISSDDGVIDASVHTFRSEPLSAPNIGFTRPGRGRGDWRPSICLNGISFRAKST